MSINPSVLSTLHCFANLDASDLATLASTSFCKTFAAKQQILQGAISFQHLLVVMSGELESLDLAPDGRLIGMSHAKAGDMIGWLSIIDGHPIKAQLSAKTDAEVLFVPSKVARMLVTSRPHIAERVLSGLALNIRRLTAERLALAQPNAFQRIFVHILNFTGSNTDLSKPTLLPKQHEIAVMANTSRETVSRAMQILVKNGIIKKQGHTVMVQKKHALEQLANDGPGALSQLG